MRKCKFRVRFHIVAGLWFDRVVRTKCSNVNTSPAAAALDRDQQQRQQLHQIQQIQLKPPTEYILEAFN